MSFSLIKTKLSFIVYLKPNIYHAFKTFSGLTLLLKKPNFVHQ